MKLFSWAHRKLPFNRSSFNKEHNADGLSDIRRQSLVCDDLAGNGRDTHTEVLTIGTLGMGNLLSLSKEEEEEEEDEDEDDDDDDDEEVAHFVSPIAYPLSPHRGSMSSNRESVSSNRESVSSVDIQKLQEELQKILYFRLGQSDHPASTSTSTSKGSSTTSSSSGGKAKAKAKKQKARSEDSYGGGKSHVVGRSEGKSVRELLPLHNFLEMPMDTWSMTSGSCKRREEGGPSSSYKKLLTKHHYRLLMQSLKSRLLHYATPTRVNIPIPLFESLLKPTNKVKERLPQHATAMDKVLHLLQRVTKRRRSSNIRSDLDDERIHARINQNIEEESLSWAISKSYRGSERFINYITTTLAEIDKHDNHTMENQGQDHQNDYAFHFNGGRNMQLMLPTSPFLENESWINTDDEYLVLEL